MTNTFKKSFLLLSATIIANMLCGQTVKTYDFSNASALDDWTFTVDNPKNGTAKYEILSSHQGISAKDGSFLALSFMNQSQIKITLTSKESFKNISHIYYDVCSTDNGKPDFTLNIVDDEGNITKNIYSNYTTKGNFGSSGTKVWGASDSDINPETTGHVQIVTYASSSGKYAAIDNIKVTYSAGPSTDATLSGISYNGTTVPGFAADKTAYEVELPAGTTTPPIVTATTTDAKATTSITQATALPGKATIDVTAEDGTTKKQYTVTFTVETANPKVETATWANIRGTAEVDNVNMTITGQVLNGKSLTLEPQFTGKYLNSYTPTGAQDFSKGSIDYIFSSATNEKTTYKVTITEAPAMSSDASLKSLTVTGYNINFSPTTYVYNVEVSGTTVPAVTYVLNDSKATAVKTDATGVPGVTKIVVTAEDGTTTATYTINFTVKVPSSSLTIHEPGIYEARTANGGYGEPLTVLNGREYEVYYINRDGDYLSLATSNADKSGAITTSTSKQSASADWVSIKTNSDHGGDTNGAAKEEFKQSIRKVNMNENGEILLHVKGFDQFSFYGKDNSDNATKCFEVYVNNVKQAYTPAKTYEIHRFDLTGECVIKITALTSSNSNFVAFSLRIPDQPKTSYIKGNDSTQNVRQTTDIAPITYFTKYASKGETKLVWDGNEATGFELTKKASSDIGDTIRLTGKALCPVGTYTYRIVNYKDGAEVNSLSGKLSVKSEIVANGVIDVSDAVRNEPITPVNFTYYALSADAVTLTWTGQTPAGLSGAGADGKYAISGTPAAVGTYTYTVSVKDGNKITGTITVETDDLGANPILFLCKDKANATNDGLYTYLTGKGMNLKARTTLNELRTKSQYDKFEWILISETVDANNGEVLEIIRNGAGKPVLNMKGFTYAPGRLDSIGWGEPDNGTVDSITKNWQNIYVQREDHPIFKALNKNKGEKIQVLSALNKNKGLMPINIKHCDGSLCLATAYTRSLEEYFRDGELQTIIHEIPAAERPDNKKYICFPIAQSSSGNLTTDGVKLINAIIAYLLDNQPTVALPELKMTGFTLDGVKGEIDQENNVVEVHINTTKHPDFNIEKAKPQITLADSRYTFTIPSQNDSVNFSTSFVSPVIYEVTDYINRRPYEIIVYANSTEDIDQTYTAGEWVNIYDIYGRMITTTNQDIYQMELPHGIYIVVTANGGTLKIMR